MQVKRLLIILSACIMTCISFLFSGCTNPWDVKTEENGSPAFAALCGGETAGFALIKKELFGSEKQYADLAELYVSEPFRRKGIGRKLFNLACKAAKELGGSRLYISAHSAEESIAAYKSYGCVPARQINNSLAEKEPCDLQLEFVLAN